jgi:hypothetical protein
VAGDRRLTRAQVRQQVRRMARELADAMVSLLERHGMWGEETANETHDEEPKPKRVRRSESALEELCAELYDVVQRASEPMAISAIADAAGLDRRDVAHPLSLLVDEGKLVRSGARRGTRYRAVRPRVGKTVRPPSKTIRPPSKTVRPPAAARGQGRGRGPALQRSGARKVIARKKARR